MSTELPPIKSYQELLNLIEQEGVEYQADTDNKSVRIATKRSSEDAEGVQLIRWQDQDNVVQFIHFVQVEVPDNRVAALESAIARLNHALPAAGLDLNHEHRTLTYRLTLPIEPRGSISAQEIRSYVGLALRVASNLTPTLRRVITGQTMPADVIADVQRQFPDEAALPAEPSQPADRPTNPAELAASIFVID